MKNFLAQTCCLLLSLLVLPAWAGDYTGRDDVAVFAQRFAAENGKDAQQVLALLHKGQQKQSILDAIARPAEKVLTWGEYRQIFIEPKRLEKGVDFWREHRALLAQISREYQVPEEIIIAIVGIETRYGKVAGNYRVLDALMTLGFDYPPRGEFFRKQLAQFLLMTDEQGLDATTLKGSYAGAMGYGQFIPGSYRSYAVDYDKDGVADIWGNPADALASVANYFSRHHWHYGEMIALQIPGPVTDKSLISDSLKPQTRVAELRKAGVQVPSQLADDALVTLMELETANGMEYWLGFENFYVITRYNHSHMYALVATELSELLKAHLDMP